MKFEVEKKSSKKKIILGLSTLVLIGIVLVIGNTFAKYSNVKTIHIASGVVNYTVDKENPKINSVDETITQNSITVTVNATDDKGIKEYYYQIDSNTIIKDTSNTHTFSNLDAGTSYTIKIYVTDIKDKASDIYTKTITTKALTSSDVLAKLKLTSKGKYNSNDTFTGIATSSDTGVYETEDDYGKSYYFRGIEGSLNNWVQFAGFYWRIIRINGNGSIRMIYSGVANGLPNDSNKTGTATQIGTSPFNHTYDDNAYLGYMMGIPLNGTGTTENYTSKPSSSYSQAHTNTYNSDIKTTLDTWYETNINNKNSTIGNNYTTYLDTEVGFCNDRELAPSGTFTYSENDSATSTSYASLGRLYKNSTWHSQTPTLKCTNKNRDLFTISSSTIGNKKLTYSVGLITSDEVIYAGGFGETDNTSYYLYTGQQYWTMSPCLLYDTGSDSISSRYRAVEFQVNSYGKMHGFSWLRSGPMFYYVYSSLGARPVINLKANTSMTGTGSETDPFVVIG